MELSPVLAGRAAGILSAVAFAPYALSVIRLRSKPNLATWIIWTVVGGVLCASYWASGARASIWVPLAYVLGPFIIALLALRYGDRVWSRFDKGCLVVAGFSLAVWGLSGSPQLALYLNILVDLAGALPTLRKSWNEPGSEDRFSWGLFVAGNAINLFAVAPWSFTSAVYPVYLFVVTLILNIILWRPRR